MSRVTLKHIEDELILTYIIGGCTSVKELANNVKILSRLVIAKRLQELNARTVIKINPINGMISFNKDLEYFLEYLKSFSTCETKCSYIKKEIISGLKNSNLKNKNQLIFEAIKLDYKAIKEE